MGMGRAMRYTFTVERDVSPIGCFSSPGSLTIGWPPPPPPAISPMTATRAVSHRLLPIIHITALMSQYLFEGVWGQVKPIS